MEFPKLTAVNEKSFTESENCINITFRKHMLTL